MVAPNSGVPGSLRNWLHIKEVNRHAKSGNENNECDIPDIGWIVATRSNTIFSLPRFS